MTFLNHTRVQPSKFGIRTHISKLFNWGQERQRLKRDQQRLAEMPHYLLRDMGMEHLSDPDQFAKSVYYWI